MLADKGYVAPIEVLVRLGWLAPARLDEWRQGRLPALERGVQANLHKLSEAMAIPRRWARENGLEPSETDYVARTRDRRRLQFSVSAKPSIEAAYRTHWVSPKLSEANRQHQAERQSRPPDLVVINALNDWSCTDCSGSGDLLIMEEPGPLCLACADMDHLVFLSRGDAAPTRRAKKASTLSAVVVRFSRARQRYERQGLLVEESALAQAEAECLADEEARATQVSQHRADVFRIDRNDGQAWIARAFPPARPRAGAEGDAVTLRFLARHGYPAERLAVLVS